MRGIRLDLCAHHARRYAYGLRGRVGPRDVFREGPRSSRGCRRHGWPRAGPLLGARAALSAEIPEIKFASIAPQCWTDGQLSTWSPDTAAAPHDGLESGDGLSCLRKICKAHLYMDWTCMINADLVVIGNVSGSHQLGPILHEVITFSILGHRLCESSTA